MKGVEEEIWAFKTDPRGRHLKRMNTSLVYFSHIVFHVQHIGNASGGNKTRCI